SRNIAVVPDAAARLPDIRDSFFDVSQKVIQGQSPGQPDRMHLHQVIYMRLTRARTDVSDPASMTRLNSKVAPYGWLIALFCALPAMIFWKETRWLVTTSLIFCVGYLIPYRQMLKWAHAL